MLLADLSSPAMSISHHPHTASQLVAEKVMRRIEIAKVARNLHDCLAFASFKAQNGWQDRTLRSIEPEVTEQLKRKRTLAEEDLISNASFTSSEGSGATVSKSSNRYSTPHPITSFKVPDHSYTVSRKRVRSASTTAADIKSPLVSWKQFKGQAHSSPALSRGDQTFESTTIPRPAHEDSPMFDIDSEGEGKELQLPSFVEPSSSIISSSPPRTPPPARRLQSSSKQSGADLLLYLANSPLRSPAVHVTHISSSSKEPPSTPPSHPADLPSSFLNTPGRSLGLFNGALSTPGPNFNLADFCNVTPSPAQAHWGHRTPGPAKTPSRLSQHPLTFEALHLSVSSPTIQRKSCTGQGLALQLGEELLPRS